MSKNLLSFCILHQNGALSERLEIRVPGVLSTPSPTKVSEANGGGRSR